VDTIENCRRRVHADADILVLVVGGRYGSIPAGATKSVTNLEYLAAKTKGIPIFAFVHRDILAVLPVWEENPAATFASIVDTPQLFAFVQDVRSADRVWTFSFDTAQDIVTTLRIQLAFLMTRGLTFVQRLREPSAADGLTGEAFRLAVEHGDGWPARLLAALVRTEVESASNLQRDHASEIALGTGEQVSPPVSTWVEATTQQAIRAMTAIEQIINHAMNDAANNFDIAGIRHSARQIGQAYRDCFNWAARLRRAGLPEEWQPVIYEQSFMLDNVIAAIEQFAPRFEEAIGKALAQPGDGPHSVDLEINLTVANKDRCDAAFAKLKRDRGQLEL
jgi:hypothetical protein